MVLYRNRFVSSQIRLITKGNKMIENQRSTNISPLSLRFHSKEIVISTPEMNISGAEINISPKEMTRLGTEINISPAAITF